MRMSIAHLRPSPNTTVTAGDSTGAVDSSLLRERDLLSAVLAGARLLTSASSHDNRFGDYKNVILK